MKIEKQTDALRKIKTKIKDYLLNILDSQKIISIRLIQDKIEDIENFGNSPAFYISKTKVNLTKLKTSIIISRYENKDLILSILDEIEGVLKNQKSHLHPAASLGLGSACLCRWGNAAGRKSACN